MSKIAIIYTGEIRTLEKTIEYFKKNILTNENVDVFAVLQGSNELYYNDILKKYIGNNLKSIQWIDTTIKETWVSIREDLLNSINIDSYWKNYLKNSGSMIEYYQMHLAIKEIINYENKKQESYDYVLRMRCDVIVNKPIYLNINNWSIENIKNYLYEIKLSKNLDTILSKEAIIIFMNTYYDKTRLLTNDIKYENMIVNDELKHLLNINNEDIFINTFKNYLENGNYLITIRKNILYFLKRKYINNIYPLGITYGKYIMKDNNYWFNAESQLQQICIENKMDIFDSTTLKEEESLYKYFEENYFDRKGNLIEDSNFLFFIRRN